MRKAGVSPRTSLAGPGSAVLREIAGPPAKRVLRAAAPARTGTASASAPGGQPPSRGAAAASASFRGRRGRR